MSRKAKEYLDYYPWDTNAFDVDMKLKKLSRRYGPLGEAIYRRMLDLIYSNSYYYKGSLEEVSMLIVDKLGSKWVTDRKCAEVLLLCCELGLFDSRLVESEIWTSVGIQQRYFSIMKQMKRKIDGVEKKYLLPDILFNAPKIPENSKTSEIKRLSSEDKTINSEEIAMKRKESIYEDNDISSVFDLYENSFARPMTQIEMQKISDWLKMFDGPMVRYALELAVSANAISLRYIEKIICNWQTNNIKTIEEAKMFSQRRKHPVNKPKRVAEMPSYSSTSERKLTDDEKQKLMDALAGLEE